MKWSIFFGVLLQGIVFAYDAVIFSNTRELRSDGLSLERLLAEATAEAPVLLLLEPEFTLGKFSREASLYNANGKSSPLASLIRSAKYLESKNTDRLSISPDAKTVSSAESFVEGSSLYIVKANDWPMLEELSVALLAKIPKDFTAVITNSEAIADNGARVKRIVTDLQKEDDDRSPRQVDATSFTDSLPLSMPPHNRTTTSLTGLGCLLYLEGVTIVVTKKQGDVPSGYPSAAAVIEDGTFGYDDDFVKCTSYQNLNEYSFRVQITPGNASLPGSNVNGPQFVLERQPIDFTMTFKEDVQHYWALENFTLGSNITIKASEKNGFIDKEVTAMAGANATGLNYMGMGAVAGYSWSCGSSPAVWFDTSEKDTIWIGIAFHNIQLQLRNINATTPYYFDSQVVDCVGTFSTGSLMGIVSGLVMLSVFIFGFLMLNSVQTMDRFDDPKQKQILINVRE